VADVRQLDPEVLPRREVRLLAEQVERDEERPLRHLFLFLDQRSHAFLRSKYRRRRDTDSSVTHDLMTGFFRKDA
jgi:hypothetical protein